MESATKRLVGARSTFLVAIGSPPLVIKF